MSQLGLFGGAPPPTPAPEAKPKRVPRAPPPVPETSAEPTPAGIEPGIIHEAFSAPPIPTPIPHETPSQAIRLEERLVVCPQRATGSMDAEDVTIETWRDVAQAMADRERIPATLYAIEENGAWTVKDAVWPA